MSKSLCLVLPVLRFSTSMKNLNLLLLLQLFSSVLLTGFGVNALSYDYTASIECLAKPHNAQYGGGIVRNPEMKDGLKGWSWFGDAKVEHRVSGDDEFIVAHSRSKPYDSMSQKVYLQKDKIYSFSAWVKVSESSVQVKAVFKTRHGFEFAGDVIAQPDCWSMIKGGLTPNASGIAEIFFESENTSVEIHVYSVSLQPFTLQEWRSHQHQSIDKTRKRNVRIRAVDENGMAMANATVLVEQNRMGFPIGCAVNKNILDSTAFQNWFTSRFTVTTFGDEMKWYSTEGWKQNIEDYSAADAMLQFFKQHNVKVRGHNVFWEDPNYQVGWLNNLSRQQLWEATRKRQLSLMSRYSGQVIHWDVVNENLHFSYFEDKLWPEFSAEAYTRAHVLDKTATMFMNEYNTLEYREDWKSTPAKYLEKLRNIQKAPGNNARMGIGLESHFGGRDPNIAYVRAALDTLGATGLPMWITELDVDTCPRQAEYLEWIMREAYSHPKVGGMVLWAGRNAQGQCYKMCLTDGDFRNLPTGDVVDKLLKEWGLGLAFEGVADAHGYIEASLFEGEYQVKVSHPNAKVISTPQSLKVDLSASSGTSQQETLFF